MSLSYKFKNFEKNFLSFCTKYLGFIFKSLKKFFKSIKRASKTRFTVMLIPHSERNVLNFKISALQLGFLGTLLSFVIVFALVFGIIYPINSNTKREEKQLLSMAEQDKRNYHRAIEEFNPHYRNFESTLKEMLRGHLPPELTENSQQNGDYQDIAVLDRTVEGETPLVTTLEDAAKNLDLFNTILKERAKQEIRISELLKIIPAKWPVGHNQGYITSPFGPAPHPIKRMWYLHKGIDIAYTRGTPIIAAANGKVIEQQYSRDYGNYIVIRHEYGFYTKYAHLDNAYVKESDIVTQGQTIGSLGNTGLSTGPHLHYEISINSQVIDPYKYIQLIKEY